MARLLGGLRFAQRNGVDAKPEAARRRPVGEHVAQMGVADVASRLDALHAVALVEVVRDDAFLERLREARPTRAAVEFARRVEQRRAAADAVVAARREQPAHLGAEGPLGAFLARDLILLGRELGFPLCVALLDATRRWLVARARQLDNVLPAELAWAGLSHGAHAQPARAAARRGSFQFGRGKWHV